MLVRVYPLLEARVKKQEVVARVKAETDTWDLDILGPKAELLVDDGHPAASEELLALQKLRTVCVCVLVLQEDQRSGLLPN